MVTNEESWPICSKARYGLKTVDTEAGEFVQTQSEKLCTFHGRGGKWQWVVVCCGRLAVLLGTHQILGQEYHRNEYRSRKTLRQAKLFYWKDSLCTREKVEKSANSPRTVREMVLKAAWGRGPQGDWSACAQFLDWLASRWSFEHHQLLVLTGICACSQQQADFLVGDCFHLVGDCFLQKELRNVLQAFVSIFQGPGSSLILLYGRFIVPLLSFGSWTYICGTEIELIFYSCGSFVMVSEAQAFTHFVLLGLLGLFAQGCSLSFSKMATILSSCLSC